MKKIFTILSAAVLLAACSDSKDTPDNQDANIALSATEITFDPQGASAAASVTVQSSGEWMLTGDTDWVTPSVKKGATGATVTFTAEANEGDEPRDVMYSIMTGNTHVKLHIVQESMSMLNPDNDTFEVGPEQEGFLVRLTTNADYTINIPEEVDWIVDNQAPQTRAARTDWLTFTALENTTLRPRNAVFHIESADGRQREISVAQEMNLGYNLSTENAEVAKEGETFELTIEHNVDYTIEVPEKYQSWISYEAPATPAEHDYTAGPVTSTERFVISASAGGLNIGKIKVKSSAGDKKVVLRQPTDNPVYGNFADENLRKYFEDEDLAVTVEGAKMELTGTLLELTELDVHGKHIASIEGIEQLTNLTVLKVNDNKIHNLDLSMFTTLTEVKCDENALETLNLGDNPITSITFRSYYGFKDEGSWYGTQSKHVVITSTYLETYNGSNNEMDVVDLSACPAITRVNCSGWYSTEKVILPASQEGNVTVDGCDNLEYK